MKTHCNQKTFYLQTENPRKIVAHFNGGHPAHAGDIMVGIVGEGKRKIRRSSLVIRDPWEKCISA